MFCNGLLYELFPCVTVELLKYDIYLYEKLVKKFKIYYKKKHVFINKEFFKGNR